MAHGVVNNLNKYPKLILKMLKNTSIAVVLLVLY